MASVDMSLRYQINIRIFVLALSILVLGGAITIWQARNAVHQEVDSSINLAVQLIKLGLIKNTTINFATVDWLPLLNTLKQARHLDIQLTSSSGMVLGKAQDKPELPDAETPPGWFISLVTSTYPATEYDLTSPDGHKILLTIDANPLDEVTEAWRESSAFFVLLLLLTFLTFIVVNLVFNKTLKPIDQIVHGLKRIETGDYQQKLPVFAVREYASIARAINHMTRQLNIAQQENRALTKHSLDIQEGERQRLAQELHDELGQSLTAIKVMAVTARHPKSDTLHITSAITEICDHLIQVVRSMMYQLHPLILTELGLKAAIDDLLKHWNDRHPGLNVQLECSDEVNALQQAITIQLYRVIQECLTNIVRHADAQQVNIQLYIKDDILLFSIQDDGKGCDMGKIQSGFGLRGMQERIKSIGGELKIISAAQKGMHITALIPQL